MRQRVVEWFRDRALRKVVRFGLPVTIGRVVTSVSGLITLALLARHLGPAGFGVLALIRTVVLVVDQYANCNTWQAVIKYGTEAIAANRTDDVRRLIKLAVVVDLASGAAAALVIAGLAFVIPAAFDWSAREAALCALYGVTVVTRVAGASDGIFRICDAYRVQAISSSVGGALMTAAVVVAVALDAPFELCVVALVAGEVANNLLVTLSSFWVARVHGYGGWARSSLRGLRATFPGIVRFMVATNAQLTVKQTSGELDMVVVGAMLGKVPAGLFRVVKQLAVIPGRLVMPFEQVLFTELAHHAAAKDHAGFGRLLRRTVGLMTAGALAIWAVAALAAEPVIAIAAGDDYLAAVPAFRWYLLAMVVTIANAPLQRAVVALGRAGTLFLFDLASLGVLAAAVIAGAHAWGLVGIAAAVLAHRVLQLAWAAAFVTRILRARRAAPG